MYQSAIQSVAVLLVVLFLLYRYVIYPGFVSPLSKIPNAHLTAPFSSLWILWTRYQRRENRTLYALHQKLGPVIRLGPKELSVDCVDHGIRSIYGGGFEKPEWYSDQFENFGWVKKKPSPHPSSYPGSCLLHGKGVR